MRMTRETKKSPGLRPQQLMQITKPLMMKNSCTPSQPNDVTDEMPGMNWDGALPYASAASAEAVQWNARTPRAAIRRSPSRTYSRGADLRAPGAGADDARGRGSCAGS